MSKPIKETPVLRGRVAERFLRDVEVNLKHDHSASFERAKVSCKSFKMRGWTSDLLEM